MFVGEGQGIARAFLVTKQEILFSSGITYAEVNKMQDTDLAAGGAYC